VEDGDPALVEAIKEKRWRELPNLPDRDRALCIVAEKLSAMPTRMTEEDWQPLRNLGFNDEALLEVGLIAAIFNFYTRLADGFGLRLDAATAEAAATGIPLKRPAPTAEASA
jgi:alkylhydroperoxidase family enzyme